MRQTLPLGVGVRTRVWERFRAGAVSFRANGGVRAMIPIQDLLHRIQWDAGFSHGDFRIGYFDRVPDRIILVSWSAVRLRSGDHRVLETLEEGGGIRAIPLHRVREVWRDGELIWKRALSPRV